MAEKVYSAATMGAHGSAYHNLHGDFQDMVLCAQGRSDQAGDQSKTTVAPALTGRTSMNGNVDRCCPNTQENSPSSYAVNSVCVQDYSSRRVGGITVEEDRRTSPRSEAISALWSECSALPEITLSPDLRRRRMRQMSQRNADAVLLGCSPTSPMHPSRDPIQPRTGSISDIHREACLDSEDEAVDLFPACGKFRPRAMTCPESRTLHRRIKARHLRRPPTPPPGGASDSEIEAHMYRVRSREKLRIPSRELCQLPEACRDKPTGAVEDEMFFFDSG